MELVHLWVEKYKNIENQGCNFSPRFDCKYDEDTNEDLSKKPFTKLIKDISDELQLI